MSESFPKFVIVPYQKMDEILEKVNRISEALLQGHQEVSGTIGEFISEQEAKALLSKGTTWFWNKRKAGDLKGRKAGNQWYYKKSDIIEFIENGKSV